MWLSLGIGDFVASLHIGRMTESDEPEDDEEDGGGPGEDPGDDDHYRHDPSAFTTWKLWQPC